MMKQHIKSLTMSIIASSMLSLAQGQAITDTVTTTNLHAVQFRVARPTKQLEKVVRFYNNLLGMPILGRFENHQGYDGVMLGMPDKRYHLEFTQYIDHTPLPTPTKENLMVLYFDKPANYKAALERLKQEKLAPVEPENPYWKGKSETFEDPDGWRVILFNGTYNP